LFHDQKAFTAEALPKYPLWELTALSQTSYMVIRSSLLHHKEPGVYPGKPWNSVFASPGRQYFNIHTDPD